MALYRKFRPLDQHKNDLGVVEKEMFEGLALHLVESVIAVIFFLLSSPKCDLFDFEKAMFEVVEWHCILGLSSLP